ncbi:VOC family protein [Streptomyces beihaiensis]|uniref:VOC family protein n=1 Tax=Streptomyces beihaiensis TaxID=2984495 RepID=A0ABT3TQA7_9ACTN|nr:VOC family protein [Streptomyces beihaiensis]MCX3059227.1 VOC family protein [Streptomyces beihaiensis]
MYPDFPEGAPCWADARLPRVEAAKRFYGDLFGWTFDEGAGAERGYYTGAYSDDRAVAALAPAPAGAVPAWTVHFAVGDAYAAADRVVAAGGRIAAGPVSEGALATVALAAGPDRAAFGLWQPGSHQGFERTGVPGAFCRAELRTPDPALSDSFYESVFGYAAQDPAPGLRTWHLAAPARRAPGGPTAPRTARRRTTGAPARFLAHFGAADPEATCAAAVRLGGRVVAAARATREGAVAVLADDQGAVFAVREPDG